MHDRNSKLRDPHRGRDTEGLAPDELEAARLADCVVSGKLLRIQGGTVRLAGLRTFACDHCRRHWSLPFGSSRPNACPGCRSHDIRRRTKVKIAIPVEDARGLESPVYCHGGNPLLRP